MSKSINLTKDAERKLQALGFQLTNSVDNGMHKAFIWSNNDLIFSLMYDRGYYDCYIEPPAISERPMDIIWLLKFIKDDKDFYEKELELANLLRTLLPDEYIALLYSNYELIKKFISAFDEEKFLRYKAFV